MSSFIFPKLKHPEVNPKPIAASKLIRIHAESAGYHAGNYARITMNDKTIEIASNSNGNHRGLHIVVVDPATVQVVHAKVFDTYMGSEEFELFISGQQEELVMREGWIVIAACKDECVRRLSGDAKRWFEEMGSAEILKLEYRQSFAFIGTIGSPKALESRATNQNESVSISKVFE